MVETRHPSDSISTHRAGPVEGGRAKRIRVTRACDPCRAGREKCDGSQPECQTCTAQDRKCSYNELPKKRGIQPNYIRTLELTLAWVFKNFPHTESKLSTNLPDINGLTYQLINGNDPSASETLHQSWRASIVNKQIDQMLSGTVVQQGSMRNDTNQQDTLDSIPEADTRRPQLVHGEDQQGAEKHVDSTAIILDVGDQLLASEISNPLPQRLQLPENAWTLVEYYFSFTHSWLPMTEKHCMLKLLYCYPQSGIERDQLTIPDHAEIWSILALSASQTATDLTKHDAHHIRKIAESLLPKSHIYKVPHIKAMMILCLIDIQEENILNAWLRVGSVIRILMLFKLLENAGATEKWCRHIYLAAFILENALASHLRAPSHMAGEYIKKVGFVDEDGMDEWSPWIDPLDSAQPRLKRAPSKAFTCLNKIVRHALDCLDHSSSVDGPRPQILNSVPLVFMLVRNANLDHGRMRPFDVVTNYGQKHRTVTEYEAMGPIASGFDSEFLLASVTRPSEYVAESIGSSALTLNQAHEATPYDGQHSSPAITLGGPSSAKIPDAFEIFEELASFDYTKSGQSTEFMQNLGFAPQIDLAEYFGDDYQSSDPFLTYILPASSDNGDIPQRSITDMT